MKYITYIFIILLVILTTPYSAVSVDVEFFGGLYRQPVDEPLTVAWDPGGVTGYELKITHFFYDGLETEIVETTTTSYTFTKLPKSSRHFEVKVRSYNEDANGVREYSEWSSSTDAGCSVVNGNPGGWLVYTYPGTPSW